MPPIRPYHKQPVEKVGERTPGVIELIRRILTAMDRKLQTQTGDTITTITATDVPHTILSATHTDTLAGAAVAGDIIYSNSTPKWTRLPIAAEGQMFTSTGAIPQWSPNQAGLPSFGFNPSGQTHSP